MSDNKVETTETVATPAEMDEATQTTAKQDKSDKPRKAVKTLDLVITDEVREQVKAVISDGTAESALLAQAAGKRTSRTDHAEAILRAIGAIRDITDEEGKPDTVWVGIFWSDGTTEAKFSDLAKALVPGEMDGTDEEGNPVKLWQNMTKEMYAGTNDKVRKSGQCSPEVLAYSKAVEAVAGSFKLAAARYGRKGATRPNRTASGEADKQDKSVESGITGIDPTTAESDKLVKSLILPFLDKMTEAVKSGLLPILPDTGMALAEACRAYVTAWDASLTEEPGEADKSDVAAQKPATQAKRTTPAKR